MPLLRRARLTCFYCGCRSAQQKSPNLRCWRCEKCEAENWLDEDGEITDPPASVSSNGENTRYVRPEPTRPIPYLDPVTTNATDDLFCQTCQKNQHLYTQSLASFYPSPSRDNFEEFERAEREYRAGLEERYPLICEACEPRVRARLRKVNYDAKADHMGRVIERLRSGGPREATTFKGWIVWIGGWMWLVSWMCQLGWNILGLMPTANSSAVVEDLPFSVKDCLRPIVSDHEVMPACVERMGSGPAYYGLMLGFLSMWWHPKRAEKLDKRYGQVLGLSEYYKLQVISLSVRCAAWFWIISTTLSKADTQRALHLFLTIFSLLAMLISYKSVTMDYTPRVSFKESPEPLLAHKSTISNPPQQPLSGTPLHRSINEPISRPQPFSINDLAPQPPQQQSQPRLPTPPPEADYNDTSAMDWTPSKPVLQSRYPAPFNPPNTQQKQQAEPSPFHGRLPQSVVSPAHRLRNPPNKTTFHAASAQKKASLFSKPNTSNVLSSRKTRPTGRPLDMFSLSSALSPSPTSPASMTGTYDYSTNEEDSLSVFSDLSPAKTFAQPRFFAPQLGEETGLEGIMETAFRIDETPTEVRDVHGRDVAVAMVVEREEQGRRAMLWRSLMGLIVVGVGLIWVWRWEMTEWRDVVARFQERGHEIAKAFLGI